MFTCEGRRINSVWALHSVLTVFLKRLYVFSQRLNQSSQTHPHRAENPPLTWRPPLRVWLSFTPSFYFHFFISMTVDSSHQHFSKRVDELLNCHQCNPISEPFKGTFPDILTRYLIIQLLLRTICSVIFHLVLVRWKHLRLRWVTSLGFTAFICAKLFWFSSSSCFWSYLSHSSAKVTPTHFLWGLRVKLMVSLCAGEWNASNYFFKKTETLLYLFTFRPLYHHIIWMLFIYLPFIYLVHFF